MGEQTMEFRSSGCALVMLAYTLLFFSFLRWLLGDVSSTNLPTVSS
jgi:hypothetical protein